MPSDKFDQLLNDKKHEIDVLQQEWFKISSRDTYLLHDEKQEFYNKLNALAKFPRSTLFSFGKRKSIRTYRKKVHGILEEINKFNDNYVNQCLSRHSSFLNGKEDNLKFPLDPDQKIAVIKDDKHNIVVAGAGSGKTSVITSRIAYLVRKNNIAPDRILSLAFTKVAADEMQERLKRDYGIEIEISTFHALGRRIIEEETNQKPKLLFDGDEREQYLLIERLFNEALESPDLQEILIEYLAYHSEQEVEAVDFEDKEEYFNYMNNKKYSSLNNIEMKSISERNIANFLFLNQIDFQYEPLVDWVDQNDENEEDKSYHPDFYLPEYDVYIEHWGLNRQMRVPEWFTISSEEYLENRQWKLEQFETHNKILIETWDYERLTDELIPNLRENLLSKIPEIKFKRLSYKDLVEKTNTFKDERDELINLVVNFIKIAKCNFFSVDDIANRIKSKKFSKKQVLFGKIAVEIYQKYQDYLKNERVIDFNDMINLAVELAKSKADKYSQRYDHVLIDEFQDISYQRLELVKSFINQQNSTKLFCVGDDWQSIYQFTGSDVRFFVNFAEYFPSPEMNFLNQNYRSSDKIVDMSNHLISNNKKQIKKKAYSNQTAVQEPLLFEFPSQYIYNKKIQFENIYNLIKNLMDNGVKANEIMVLSRFNSYLKDLEIFCGARKIPTEEKAGGIRFYSAHKSKGSESMHVILCDITSGLYGFPCEIQDSSVMEMAKRFETDSFIDEERRLFYVALTRSKKFLYIFTLQGNNSMFLDEIKQHVLKIMIDTKKRWDEALPSLIRYYLEGTQPKVPILCPECTRFLESRKGQYGSFLGCSGYPKCKFTFNLERTETSKGETETESATKMTFFKPSELPRRCPKCNNKLAIRKGQYGGFLGCGAYPNCRFTFDITKANIVICPKCNKRMVVRKGNYGYFLGCVGYPNCKYTVDFRK
ncbi:MAG: UvrD-helicase domain-containing protein [Candidatus Thorarchaeota archaeon]